MATKTKDRRDRWFLEELLEPEDGHLTPLGASVAAVFGLVAFVVGRYIDSTLEDREALLARHRWETQHRQQRNQRTQDELRGDDRGDPDGRDEVDTAESATEEHVPTYDRCESSINRDLLRENEAAPDPPAGIVDGDVVAVEGADPDVTASAEVSPATTAEVEKHTDGRPYSWLGARAAAPRSARGVERDGLTPRSGHSAGYDGAYAGRRYADELPAAAVARGDAVVEVEHPDAATAVAAAAEAVARANGLDPRQPVVVVVAEDVPDWVDEDPGF